jgi:hypothetical protein
MSFWYLNKSNEDIFVISKEEQWGGSCPDTILPVENINYSLGDTIKSGKVKQKIFAIPTCDTMRIFILSVDTVNKYTWEQIRLDYNILKRYDISLQDLKRMDIYYPPSEKMKDIKMYPPYK